MYPFLHLEIISPEVGSSNFDKRFNIVDFPHPEGPKIAIISLS